MRRVGSTDQRANSRGRQHAGPGVEDLQGVGAGSELRQQIFDRVLDQHVDDFRERLRMPVGHHPRRRLVGRAMAGDHVGRHRPWRAAEADQRDLWIERAAHDLQRLEHRRELAEIGVLRQRRDLGGIIQRLEPRTLADLETHRTAERIGDHQDVGEDDRRIEAEPPDRLQRHLGGKFRVEAEIEEAAGLGAQLAIFRQIAAGLPHHPDRRNGLPLAGEDVDEGLCR